MSDVMAAAAAAVTGAEPPPAYTYATYDLLSGVQLIDHLPGELSDYGRQLHGTAQVTLTLPVTDPRLSGLDVWSTTLPRRTLLWVLRDGVPVWDGIITARRYQRGVVRLTARETVRWYLERRRFRPLTSSHRSLQFNQTDQFQIFRAILQDCLDVTWNGLRVGDIGIDMGNEMSGVLRDRRTSPDGEEDSAYQSWNFDTYLDLLDDLADLENGFEWRTDPYLDDQGRPRRRLVLGYPRLGGATPPDDVLTLEYPGQIVDWDWPEDGADSANWIAAIGAGEEKGLRWSSAIHEAELEGGYPLLEATTAHKSVSTPATLQALAAAELARVAGDIVVPELQVRGRPNVSPGQWVRIRIADPYRFGDQPLDTTVRIVATRTQPSPEMTWLDVEEAR